MDNSADTPDNAVMSQRRHAISQQHDYSPQASLDRCLLLSDNELATGKTMDLPGPAPRMRPTHMTQASAFGRRLGRFLHLKDAPPSLATRSLRSVELAVMETWDDNPVPGLSGSLTAEDAFLVSLKLHDYPDCELWERGKCTMKRDVRAGATYLYDLKCDPRYVIDKPFHNVSFYLPRSALDGIAEQSSAPRIGNLACELGVGHDDAIIRSIGASFLEGLRRPAEANQLFVDHMMLALTAH